MEQYNVKIDAFEGPLDLLLHLINRLEIDIYDIPMAEITEQYLFYIHTMKELQLDIASEYLVMAATLLAIKSKMLLPKQEDALQEVEFEVDIGEDPREELIERLVEYRKYKEAAMDLKSMEQERSLMFSKPPSDLSQFVKEPIQELDLNVTLYDMLGALQKLFRRKKLQRPLATKIARQEISLKKRMAEISAYLNQNEERRTSFYELFPVAEREHIIVTFLAILELMKRNEIIVEQEYNFAEIFVERNKRGREIYNG
ncbi:segregation/condensation protein A [Bacillus aquiflavi]|uniref:Segregation and condensation protein A n=1 Tax=Bacillus aquiflavi TaxID=2672567 RepID=A0A6B3W205_9BACI|nr:segregation/condensation protein A [Bacillus aquiflavi]MBA4537307.1 segregation/condensation protein A [Bacillus aquiflavi]NEY81564.1 segregation/condensation protein A [Bacillus aquiflavi]UAC47128.1 segregation/condensation protein A [Bacillus aquiflavi]